MKNFGIFTLLLLVCGCASIIYQSPDFASLYGPAESKPRILTAMEQATVPSRVSFAQHVKPILDSRCVVCHGCYDAPCQLKLGSIEGVDRGGNKQKVYDFARLGAVNPTRLFVDAANTEEWRTKDFHPVLNERADSAVGNLDNSVFAKLLQLKQFNPLPTSGKLDESYDLSLDRDSQCPTVEEFPQYQHEHPQGGMPYALPGLLQEEQNLLLQWLKEGAKAEPLPSLSLRARGAVEKWEHYFNGASTKQKLVFRYLYEHLFIGHIHFKGHPDTEFYQWVRSKTPSGQPIVEINSVRPYEDPGSEFYYRLKPVTETIVDKNHFVYELSDDKMHRFDELFFQGDYPVTGLPSYKADVAANPFWAFRELPLDARYRFLLDDAGYFVSGFIKGPVCRGVAATSSIRDRFWVFFFQPGRGSPEQINRALADNHIILGLPGEESDDIGLFGWSKFDDYGREYLAKKDAYLHQILPPGEGFGLENIWDGDGQNTNAALTIFRHQDSATVVPGLIGNKPFTAWVVDYPILERLHYLLVAGYNVFGSAGHQLASRTYMDLLRQDGENNFLRFMPSAQRQAIHDLWYQGSSSFRSADPLFNIDHETLVNFQTNDPKPEFFDLIRQRLGKAAGPDDSINDCPAENCIRSGINAAQQAVDQQMRELAKIRGAVLQYLPEMSLVQVKMPNPKDDLVYTVLANRAYRNISWLLFHEDSRLYEKDSLTIVPGFVGSYPNFFFTVDEKRLGEFVQTVTKASSEADILPIYQQFGVRRTNPDIWRLSDWFNQQHRQQRGQEAGWLDMSRYGNF